MNNDQRKIIEELLDYAERNICYHEDTFRGGAIWTICRTCGKKWADDEGGFKEAEIPQVILDARAILEELDQLDPGPLLTDDGKLHQTMITLGGKSFKCQCGCNVFHYPNKNDLSIYECNACGEHYGSN